MWKLLRRNQELIAVDSLKRQEEKKLEMEENEGMIDLQTDKEKLEEEEDLEEEQIKMFKKSFFKNKFLPKKINFSQD